MLDDHVSYKANFPGLTCKQPAPNLRLLWARQQNAFRVVFFWRGESSRILRANWEVVDQFLSLHVFIPRPLCDYVAYVTTTTTIWHVFPGFQFVSVHTFIVKISRFLKNIRTNNIVP